MGCSPEQAILTAAVRDREIPTYVAARAKGNTELRICMRQTQCVLFDQFCSQC